MGNETYNEVKQNFVDQLKAHSTEASDIFIHLEWAESESEELKIFHLVDEVLQEFRMQIIVQSMRFSYEPKHLYKDNRTRVRLMIMYRNRL